MALKRVVDVVVSAAGLVVLAPAMAVIALLFKLDRRGPALFIQLRAGRKGQAVPDPQVPHDVPGRRGADLRGGLA